MNCVNCGAPPQGKPVCAYCGSHDEKAIVRRREGVRNLNAQLAQQSAIYGQGFAQVFHTPVPVRPETYRMDLLEQIQSAGSPFHGMGGGGQPSALYPGRNPLSSFLGAIGGISCGILGL